jgi:hypothetical protein
MSDILAEQDSEMNTDMNVNLNVPLVGSITETLTNQSGLASKEALSEVIVDNSPFLNLDTNEPSSLNENYNSYKKAFNVIFELSDDEIGKIEEHVRNKIINNGENFLQQHETLKANYEKFKIEYEQRFIELEADFNESQTKLGLELKNSHTFRLKATENGKKCLFFFL